MFARLLGSVIFAGLIWKFGFLRTIVSFITAGQIAGVIGAIGFSLFMDQGCGRSFFCEIVELSLPTGLVIITFIGTLLMLKQIREEEPDTSKARKSLNTVLYFIFMALLTTIGFGFYLSVIHFAIVFKFLLLVNSILLATSFFVRFPKHHRMISLALVACIPLSYLSFDLPYYFFSYSNYSAHYFIYTAVLFSLPIAGIWGWFTRGTNAPANFFKRQNNQ